MASTLHKSTGDSPADIAIHSSHGEGGRLTAIVSAIALLLSGFNFWDSTLKQPDLKVYVPPIIQYASPYNNTNFEVFAVPVTLINDGGRSGTVLSIELEATNVKTGDTKRFYAADFGRWSMERTRASAYQPFAPIALAGKASRTETVLFYTKSDKEKPAQLVTEPGRFRFKLTLDEAEVSDFGIVDRYFRGGPGTATFEMELRNYDARAFQNGTLALHRVAELTVAGSGERSGKTSAVPPPAAKE